MSRGTERSKRTCQVCGTDLAAALRPAALVRSSVSALVEEQIGRWDEDGWICIDDLQTFRNRYVEGLLQTDKGELTQLEEEVLHSLREHEILSSNPEVRYEEQRTLGQQLADRLATFGGSWVFLGCFGAVLAAWMLLNSYVLATRSFDPYPFILLNLVLSCIAAIQAPVIMMSQRRQESRDRISATHDYQINLKAELEIRHLHQKIDHLLSHQWERLIKIQEIQMELINEVRTRR